MKGLVFTEFLEMVEERFSPEIADRIIGAAELPSGGAYTSLGTYDAGEMTRLVTELSRVTAVPAPQLVHAFGKHLFGRFLVHYPEFFKGSDSAYSLLERVEDTIHVEVLKLYPDAEVPRFGCCRPGSDQMELVYKSPRGLADLAAGLIESCAEHFGEEIEVQREDLSGGRNTEVRFFLTRHQSA